MKCASPGLPGSLWESAIPSRRLAFAFTVAVALLGCSIADRMVGAPAPAPTAVTDPAPIPSATFEPTPSRDPIPDMDRIHDQVSSVRGLYPTGPLDRQLLSPESIRQRVTDDFLGEYTQDDASDDARLLALLGLLEPDFDLWTLYADFYEEQVAGYYDPEVQKMYVVGSTWGGSERLTYAHEYVHALQDQNYDLEEGLGYSDEGCEEDSERCAAISALIEGDATLAEEQWWRAYSTEQDLKELSAMIAEYTGEVFDAAPAYLQQDFLFPYEEGLAFVRSLFRQGGWAAVDAAYLEPPTTTEHILHPELYGNDDPIPVALPDLGPVLGQGWRELDADVLGEWFTRLVLDEEIPEWEAEEAAAGWGGDAYRAWTNDQVDEGVLVLLTVWDVPRDAFEFVEAFGAYAEWRFGERKTEQAERRWSWQRGAVSLERAYDQTLWILAPDAETAEAIRDAIEFPLTDR